MVLLGVKLMGLGFYTPLLNMSRGFLFAQSLRPIIVYTTLQMNLAQFPVFHLRNIKHPQPIRNLIETVRHELCSMPASTFSFFLLKTNIWKIDHFSHFFTPLFSFLFEDYFCFGQIKKSAQTLHYTIPMSTLLSAKRNRMQRHIGSA